MIEKQIELVLQQGGTRDEVAEAFKINRATLDHFLDSKSRKEREEARAQIIAEISAENEG
jgi:hypothetical protein